jgi:hypothetical protein
MSTDGQRPSSRVVIRVVAFFPMREPAETHPQLISLKHLRLGDRELDFEQAFVSLEDHDGARAWTCTLRGVPREELSRLEGELSLRAEALDGRTIEGRLAGPAPPPPSADTPATVELAGLGALLIDGREL